MRLLTFSFVQNCKLKLFCYQVLKRCIYDKTQPKTVPEDVALAGDPSYIEVSPTWPADEERELRARVLRDMRVLPGFVSEAEEQALLAELEPVLKRMRYEFDHWDNAIQGFRETERAQWSAPNAAVIARVHAAAFGAGGGGAEPLPHAHVLDLAAAGHIKPHVDAVRFCGAVIAGVCLASSAVMRLQACAAPHRALDALLERRCLYIMSGAARYSFTHAVLGGADSAWRGRPLARRRRVAVIARQRPDRATDAAPQHDRATDAAPQHDRATDAAPQHDRATDAAPQHDRATDAAPQHDRATDAAPQHDRATDAAPQPDRATDAAPQHDRATDAAPQPDRATDAAPQHDRATDAAPHDHATAATPPLHDHALS